MPGHATAHHWRVLLDNDGSNLFHRLTNDWERDVRDAVEECPGNVDTYLLCAGAGTYYFPTTVGTMDPHAGRLREAYAAGGDPFGALIGGLRDRVREVFVTFRMNDVHKPDDADGWNLPNVRREHPDCVVDAGAIRRGDADWMAYCLDYSRHEVREYVLAVIGELLERYPVDGLSLDWMRFPRHLSGSRKKVWSNREALTGFVAEVRALTEAKGVALAARVPTSLEGCRYVGLDVAAWTERGLVDFLVASPFLTTDFAPPLEAMRTAMGSHPVPLYAGFDFNHATQNHCPESLRATCASLYDAGAEGIYLFNFPCWTEYLGARPYHWLAGLENPQTVARKPLLFSVSHRANRIEHVDLPGMLPLNLEPGARAEMPLTLPTEALPARRALLLIRTDGPVRITVNGCAVGEPIGQWGEIFLEYVAPASRYSYDAEESSFLFRVAAEALHAGMNIVAWKNTGDSVITVHRVNLGLW